MDGTAFQPDVEIVPYIGVLSGAHAKLAVGALGQCPVDISQSLEGLIWGRL